MNMFFTIAGFIATVIFGILSIDLFKRRHRPRKITYFPVEAINLYRNLAKGFDNLEIIKDKKPIKNNIVFLSGILACNGDMDITGHDNKIHMCLPEGCKWIDSRVDTCSEGFNVNFIIDKTNPQNADIEFGLFRVSEFVKVQGLVEYEDNYDSLYDIHERLTFLHRLENTGDIKVGEIVRKRIKPKYLWILVIELIVLFSFLSGCLYLFGNFSQITYIDKDNNQDYYVSINKDDMIVIEENSVQSIFKLFSREKISVVEFKERFLPVFAYRRFNENSIPIYFIGGFVIVTILPMHVFLWVKIRRRNKLFNLFSVSQK